MAYTKEQRVINQVLGNTKQQRTAVQGSPTNSNFVLPTLLSLIVPSFFFNSCGAIFIAQFASLLDKSLVETSKYKASCRLCVSRSNPEEVEC